MQKTPIPNFDLLQVPPFESEAKRISAAAAKAAKPQNVSIVEAGTSVAPRSRPKGSSSVHGGNALGLGLPPSPSPRQNITSPQPQAQAQLPQPVVEQFQANFPAMPAAVPPLPAPQAQAAVSAAPVAAASNLFESSGYPDPFNEPATAAVPAANLPATEDTNKEEVPQELAVPGGTPTKNMLTPPKPSGGGGHRRNVSDTSAFNK